ncbi:MAG: hypothetical protein H0W90_05960 [Actinobacteria bacterium]|nr:hypothetical protein [Actinomycetota bacterium]
MIFAALGFAVLALPGSPQAALPGASVTVCQVTGSASAPNYAQVDVSVDQVAAYLNQYPGSFVGACPSGGSGGTTTPIATVNVCQVTVAGGVTSYAQVQVAVDQLQAFLNQNPGSFQGACPASSGGGTGGTGGGTGGVVPVNGSVTVCRVTGSASAPDYALLTVAVSDLAAYLNQNSGSFVGTCPSSGAPAGSPGLLPNGFVTLCSLTGSLSAPQYAQVTVALTDLQAALNRQPGSFVGACPTAGDVNGNPGPVPSGFATICRLTGNATTPYATLTVAVSRLGAYLNQAGNILAAPNGGCPTAVPGGGGTVTGGSGPGSQPGSSPGSSSPGSSSTIIVHTTPNTVVTATGAGTNSTSTSNAQGEAKVKVKPKHKGIVTIRGAGGKVIKSIGVTGKQSGAQLTG